MSMRPSQILYKGAPTIPPTTLVNRELVNRGPVNRVLEVMLCQLLPERARLTVRSGRHRGRITGPMQGSTLPRIQTSRSRTFQSRARFQIIPHLEGQTETCGRISQHDLRIDPPGKRMRWGLTGPARRIAALTRCAVLAEVAVQPVAALVRSVVINRVDGRKWRATADARVLAEVVAGSVGVAAGSPVVVEVAAAVAVAAAEVEE